jgi:nucleoid-associated protein YgaU
VPQSMIGIPATGTRVLAEETSLKDLLEKAKEFYRLGLEEKAKGNYEQSQSYFSESLRYVEIYKSYAVKGVYTVRLIPERRDCLWRIAEYPQIYGDPYLWPKIWRRNRKLIQNPDLIYPGWQLVIPLQ